MVMEHDPLLKNGIGNVKKHDISRMSLLAQHPFYRLRDIAVLTLVPMVVFVMAVGVTFYPSSLWALVEIGALVVVGVAIHLNAVGYKYRFGVLWLIATCAGTLVGSYCYYQHMIFYYTYQDMRAYTNVAASQPGSSFKDASMIMFTQDSMVDISRALGYMAPENTDTYCVAPVVASGMTSDQEIQFWAIGKNCCHPRGSFNCDSSHDAAARSAIMLLEPDDLVSWLTKPLLAGVADREAFAKAIELNEAEYNTVTAKRGDRRLLRWAQDPKEVLQGYADAGYSTAGVFLIVYFVISFVLALVLQCLCPEGGWGLQATTRKEEPWCHRPEHVQQFRDEYNKPDI